VYQASESDRTDWSDHRDKAGKAEHKPQGSLNNRSDIKGLVNKLTGQIHKALSRVGAGASEGLREMFDAIDV
jgi:hypothetical protein